MHDTALLNSWITVTEVIYRSKESTVSRYDYSVNIYGIPRIPLRQSKTHDLATPLFKRPTRHAHKTSFDSFYESNDDVGDDDGSVLDEFLAHMSVSNEPMSEDAVNALQVYSTFQQQRRRNNGPPRVRDPDSEIPQPLYGELSRELRLAWSRQPNDIKERILIIKQQAPKQGAKKNVDLGVYMIESEGYESVASAYSEHTYDYDVDG